MMFDDTRGDMQVSTIVKIILGLLVISILVILVWNLRGSAEQSIPLCNNDLQKCACFYRGGDCPDVYVRRITNSEMCPPNTDICTDDTYESLLADAKGHAKSTRSGQPDTGTYGTCCLAPAGKVSPTRLNSWDPPTMTDTAAKSASTTGDAKAAPASPAVPATPIEVTLHARPGLFSDDTVTFRYNRPDRYWEYEGFGSWAQVPPGGSYHDMLERVGRSLQTKDELAGYRYLANLAEPELDNIDSVPNTLNQYRQS